MSNTASTLQARFDYGVSLQRLGRVEEAAACYRALLREAPHVAQLHYNLGLALLAQALHEAAVTSFRTALRLRPAWPEALVNLANGLHTLGQFTEAEQCCRAALHLAPNLAEAQATLSTVLRDMGKLEEAISAFSETVLRQPANFKTYNNLGNALKSTGRVAEALDAYRVALRLQPGNAAVHYNLSTLYLVSGRFAEGWVEAEYRWLTGQQGTRPFDSPLWDGQSVQAGAVLLYVEQGLGDAIQFCRYVPLVAARARVILWVVPELRCLLADLHPAVTLISGSGAVPEHVFQCPLLSLPRVFGTTLDTIPNDTPYLHADPLRVARWRERLAPLGGLRVGVVWAGNPDNAHDHLRSIPFALFQRLLAQPGVSFVSLQKGRAAAPPGTPLQDWSTELVDLTDTAALIEALDLVIGVDTAVVHLAGALNKPVWLLNRFDTDWRWLLDRSDSPWYPALRQFRQTQLGDWGGVIDQVLAALDERFSQAG